MTTTRRTSVRMTENTRAQIEALQDAGFGSTMAAVMALAVDRMYQSEKESIQMEKKTTWEVYEDNSGGLFLYVFNGDKIVYAADGFEKDPGLLRDTVTSLKDGDDTSGWDGHNAELAASYESDRGFLDLVATDAETYPGKMGTAGRIEFSRTLEQLLTQDYGDSRLRYVGSVFGDSDHNDASMTGRDWFDGLYQMFDDDLNSDPVLETHPVHSGATRGWYIQSGHIWYRSPSLGEECVFEVLD